MSLLAVLQDKLKGDVETLDVVVECNSISLVSLNISSMSSNSRWRSNSSIDVSSNSTRHKVVVAVMEVVVILIVK